VPSLEAELDVPAGIVPGFHAQLVATGGKPPYRFTVLSLPRGLHADAAGRVSGAIERPGPLRLRVRVQDAAGRTRTLTVS
jgi:hypothetical protein